MKPDGYLNQQGAICTQARYWRRPGFVASAVLASYPPLIAGLAGRLRGLGVALPPLRLNQHL